MSMHYISSPYLCSNCVFHETNETEAFPFAAKEGKPSVDQSAPFISGDSLWSQCVQKALDNCVQLSLIVIIPMTH